MTASRRPISELRSLFEDSVNFAEQVSVVSEKYSSWRDVPLDGNCFYHCVLRELLEHFCRPSTPISELLAFYNRLEMQEYRSITEKNSKEEVESDIVVLRILLHLIDCKQINPKTVGSVMEKLLADKEFVSRFIRLLRRLSYAAFIEEKPEPIYFERMEEDEILTGILLDQHTAGECDCLGLSLALNLDFRDIEMGRNNSQVQFLTRNCERRQQSKGNRLTIHVALITNHYYVLYEDGLEAGEEGDYAARQNSARE